MKILIVSSVQTHPTTSGSGSFIRKYTTLLKEMGHEVYFLHVIYYAFTKKNKRLSDEGVIGTKVYWRDYYFQYRTSLSSRIIEEVKKTCRKNFSDYYAQCDDHYPYGLTKFVSELHNIHHFDACIVNYYWFTKLFNNIDIKRKALMAHDSFTYNNIRNGVKSLLNLKPNEEAKALQRCPYIFAMQEEERIFFTRLSPLSKVLTSYCNYEFINLPKTNNHNIVLLSSGFQLNVNGLIWFVDKIFPLILREYPDCRLKIGGSLCNAVQDSCPHPNIDLIGFVDNARDLYELGDIAINPTYQGTGLKIKTFESIAYNKVTMVHPHSINGIFDKENAPLFASDNPVEWVNFLHKVWDNPEFLDSFRTRNKEYIDKMNLFIINQFEQFLK
jgi:glycosyltransferase involved in cell wall biosynthesis